MRLTLDHGGVDDFEIQFKDINGKPFWAVLSNRPLLYQGEDCRLNAIFVIDDRKRAEQALAEKEAHLRLTLDHMPSGIRLVDKDRKYVFFNHQFLDLYDFPEELLKVGESNRVENRYQAERGDFGAGDPDALTDQWLTELPVQSEPTSWIRDTVAGKTLQVRTAPMPDGSVINIVTDITERKRAEKEVNDSRELLQALADNIPEFVSFKDLDGRFQFVNKRFEDWTKQDRKDVVGKTVHDIYPEHQAKSFAAQDRECLNSQQVISREILLDYPDGNARTVVSTRFPVRSSSGDVLGLGTVNYDLTERKAMEDALRESQQRLIDLLDVSPIAVSIIDSEARRLYGNSRLVEMLGLDRESLIGGRAVGAFRGEDLERLHALYEKDGVVHDFDVEGRRPDGEKFWATRTMAPIEFEGKPAVIHWAYDITDRKRAEQEALEQTRILELTLQSMGQGLTMYDSEWNLVSYNQRYKEHFDLPDGLFEGAPTFDDVVGATMGLDYGPERDERLKVVKDSNRMTNVWRREFTRPGGRSLDVLSVPIPAGGFVVTTTDITERMEAEAEIAAKEAQLRAALDNMSDGIVMIDSDIRVSLYNDRYLELMELDAEMVPLGSDIYDIALELARKGFYGAGEPEKLAHQRYNAFKRGEAAQLEFHAPQGRDLDVHQQPTPDGDAVITFTDITERKRYEAEIHEAREKAESLAQLRAEFVATVSHEVRTPMNGVLGMAQLLQDAELDKESRECVDIIVDSSYSLLRIVDDLLDIAKLDAGGLELERIPFIVGDVVGDSVQLMRARAQDKGLILRDRIDPATPTVLLGDALRLRQVLLNLLSNAIKFTESGSVTVKVSVVASDAGQAVIDFAVVDTGKGISAEAHEKLFSPYAQESVDVARKYGGSGLGLAICRRLVEMMGGEIMLESAVGEGSTFRFAIPFEIGAEADLLALANGRRNQASAVEAVHKVSRPLMVLQVEDNATNRHVVRRMLTQTV